jgi:hypothetical protein
MTTFHSLQSDWRRRVCKKANVSTLQISVTNYTTKLHSHVHEGRIIQCNNVSSMVQKHGCKYCFYAKQALPLPTGRILRLAGSSPMNARSPARRSRDGRETSGKKSGKMSRVMSAQLPSNGRTVATAMPPSIRQDDSQDNLPCAGLGRAMSAPETYETTRNLAAQGPMQRLASSSSNFSPSVLTETFKNYEHTNHTNARS